MESFFFPLGIVTLSEIGDKTQLLALLLAVRFHRPLSIILGILAATLTNHLVAGAIGNWFASFFSRSSLSWVLAICFLIVAIWTLIPDKLDNDDNSIYQKYGPFIATFIAFFLAEMGDKTQVATVIMAAQYANLWLVVAGTTVGMLVADIPVVLLGNFSANKLPLKPIRILAALIFFCMAILAIYNGLS